MRYHVQTFLPLPDYAESAAALDWRRLNKQRAETKQLVMALLGEASTGWRRHPAARMWAGYELQLCHYGVAICTEWRQRGYRDVLLDWFNEATWRALGCRQGDRRPWWFGDPTFHLSHRSNLLRKNPTHYRPLWPNDPDDLDYYWPVR